MLISVNRGFSIVGLSGPKCGANVGGAMRAAMCYGAAGIIVSTPRYKKQATDTTKAWKHIPVTLTDDLMRNVPHDCVPVVVEVNEWAHPLPNFVHPERAFYIFGPEDGIVPHRIQNQVALHVQIPTRHCMNLAATVNVLLYDRLAKQCFFADSGDSL